MVPALLQGHEHFHEISFEEKTFTMHVFDQLSLLLIIVILQMMRADYKEDLST